MHNLLYSTYTHIFLKIRFSKINELSYIKIFVYTLLSFIFLSILNRTFTKYFRINLKIKIKRITKIYNLNLKMNK